MFLAAKYIPSLGYPMLMSRIEFSVDTRGIRSAEEYLPKVGFHCREMLQGEIFAAMIYEGKHLSLYKVMIAPVAV